MINRIILILLFLLIVACIGFLFFYPNYIRLDHLPEGRDITAGMLGALITVAITAALLRYQTTSEVNRDKSIAVFQEKLKLYEGFCSFLIKISSDARFQQEEEQALRLWSMRLSLICGHEVAEAIDHFFVQTHRYKTLFYEQVSEEQRQDLPTWHRSFYRERRQRRDPAQCFMSIGSLIAHLKHDLGESEISNLKDVTSAKHAVDEILRSQTRG